MDYRSGAVPWTLSGQDEAWYNVVLSSSLIFESYKLVPEWGDLKLLQSRNRLGWTTGPE